VNAALLPVEALVASAAGGDQGAWNAIVDRYGALVWSICFRFRLSHSDAADVSQTVWLHTVEKLDSLREPAALPGWLATTTRRECLKVASLAQHAPQSLDGAPLELRADEDSTAPDAELLAAERRAMIREAFAQLPETCQRLLGLLVGATPAPYAEISARLGIPVGSIGPTRARCLEKLRACPVVTRWAASLLPERQGDDRHV
jgi:RNA polymerase sigma factor (sigma-70 family)